MPLTAKRVLPALIRLLAWTCFVQGLPDPTKCMINGVRGWSQVPGLGEADKPGPFGEFDDEEFDNFSGNEMEGMLFPGEENWMPDSEDEEVIDACVREQPIDDEDVNDWLRKHKDLDFVAVPNKKRTKKSKFEGQKPG